MKIQAKWYIVQIVSNYEQRAKESLENRNYDSENMGVKDIYLPTVTTYTKTGKERTKPMFPGYLFIKVAMTEDNWFIIRNTQYVTGIIGSSGRRAKPTPIPQEQIDKIINKIANEARSDDIQKIEQIDINFTIGDVVEVFLGNFKGNFGRVLEIIPEKGITIVELEFFGRQTAVTVPIVGVRKK